jgi:hypothetical protein
MNEEPKSIWKKSWKGRGAIFILSLLIALAVFLATLISALANWSNPVADIFVGAALTGIIFVVCCLSIIYIVLPLLRWLFWKHWRRALFVLACLATLIAVFYAEEDWRGKHDWEKFKREWEAKGEKFDRASVVPPPVPEDRNFALTPLAFTSYGQMLTRDGKMIPSRERDTNFVNRMDMNIAGNDSLLDWRTNGTGNWQKAEAANLTAWQTYYRALGAKTNLFPIAPQSQTPAQDVLLALSKYDSTIEELRQDGQLPYSRFPLEYDKDDPWAMLLPHLAVMKRCAQVLQLRALAELQNGQSDLALADIKLLLRLTDSIRTEPVLISHLVRIAMVNLALQPVWEGLAEHRWSDGQLAELDRELAGLDFLSDYKLAMRGEMVLCQVGVFDYLRHHPEQLSNLSGDGNTAPPAMEHNISTLIPSGWFYQNQLHCARAMVEFYLPAADVNQGIFSPTAIQQADTAIAAECKRPNPYNILERLLLPALGNAAKKFAQGQNSVNMVRAAIALERYRLAHGEYPESLDALLPQFIARLPHDIINGQPLHYRRTSDPSSQSSDATSGQFVLYSVGWNETDDNGEVGLKEDGSVNRDTGDWVWRYPSK